MTAEPTDESRDEIADQDVDQARILRLLGIDPADLAADEDDDDVDVDQVREDPARQPYRDGQVHVMSAKCSTCVFHPGNLMSLRPGRLKDMAEAVQKTGVPFACHQTLDGQTEPYKTYYGGQALCHGAVDAFGDQSVIMRLAHAMETVVDVEPYPGKSDTNTDSQEG